MSRKFPKNKRVIESPDEKCQRMCGDGIDRCLLESREQMACIADSVNCKASGIQDIIEAAKRSDNNEYREEILKWAIEEIDELATWMKFLQVAQDLRALVDSMYDKSVVGIEKRRNKRYSLERISQKYIQMNIKVFGSLVPVRIIDFSWNGVKFKSPFQLEIDSIRECTLSSFRFLHKEIFFKIKIKHCFEQKGVFITGAQMDGEGDDVSFTVFNILQHVIADKAE